MDKDSGRTVVRRADRAITDEKWIRSFLKKAPSGVVGTSLGDQPFLTSVLFAYDQARNVIYFHTARVGRLRTNIEVNPRVCLTANSMGRLLPADKALEFSVEYASVVVFGIARIAEDPRHGLELLMQKYAPHLAPGRDYRPMTNGEILRTSVFELAIDEWSGKKKTAEPDYPGAFLHPDINLQLI